MLRADLERGGVIVQGLLIGGVSVLAGIGLAVATTIGVVNSQTSGSYEPKGSVLQYGATK
jgi:hypothetical protein